MAIDITKKPTAGGDEGGEKGGAGPRRSVLDITKKPADPVAGPIPAVGVSTAGGNPEPAEKKPRWPWLLAAAAALIGVGVYLWSGEKPGHQAGSAESGAVPARTTDSGSSQSEATAVGSDATKTVQEPGAAGGIGGQAGTAPGQEPATAMSEAGKSGEGQGAVASANADRGIGGSDRSPAMPAAQETAPGQGRGGELAGEQRSVAGVGARAGKEESGTPASSSQALATSASTASKQAQKPGGAKRDESGMAAPDSMPVGAPVKGADQGAPSSAATNPASAVLVVRFNLNSSEVTEDEAARIRNAMESIGAKAPGGVLVEGFTCDLGPEEFNLELAQKRSASVARAIREAPGGENLEVVGRAFGEFHPVVPNETEASRKENRRVVVSLK